MDWNIFYSKKICQIWCFSESYHRYLIIHLDRKLTSTEWRRPKKTYCINGIKWRRLEQQKNTNLSQILLSYLLSGWKKVPELFLNKSLNHTLRICILYFPPGVKTHKYYGVWREVIVSLESVLFWRFWSELLQKFIFFNSVTCVVNFEELSIQRIVIHDELLRSTLAKFAVKRQFLNKNWTKILKVYY